MIVRRRIVVVENLAQLLKMRRSEQVRDVTNRLRRQQPNRLSVDPDDRFAIHAARTNKPVTVKATVCRGISAQRKHVVIRKFGHRSNVPPRLWSSRVSPDLFRPIRFDERDSPEAFPKASLTTVRP